MGVLLQDFRKNKHWLYFSLAATFLWGLAAHGYMFLDNSLSHDSLREFHAEILGNTIKMGSGRIFTPIYRELIGSDLTLPWLCGILSLLWIGLAVYLTVRIFAIESRTTVVLVAGIFSTNICVSAITATYIHDLDSYMFSLLCAVAAVYFWKKVKYGWLPGALLISVSIGIYQAFLFVAVTLVMFDCIFRLYQNAEFKTVFFDGLRAVGMIALGGIAYYVMMKAMLSLSGMQLVKGEYNSMDLILHQSAGNICKLVAGAYRDWFFRLWGAYSSYPGILIKGMTALFFGICIAGIITMLCSRNSGILEKGLCLLLIVLLPFGMNLIYVLTVSHCHELMSYPIALFYLFVLLNADYLVKKWGRICTPVWYGCVLLTIVLVFGNVRFSNGMYMKKDLEYDAYHSLMTRIVARMEMTEGYVPGETTVVFVGLPENRKEVIPGFKEYWNVTGMLSTDVIYSAEISRYQAYFDYVMCLPIKLADAALWNEVARSEAAGKMPSYPAEGCMEYQEDVLVIKLGRSEDKEMPSFYILPDEAG